MKYIYRTLKINTSISFFDPYKLEMINFLFSTLFLLILFTFSTKMKNLISNVHYCNYFLFLRFLIKVKNIKI